MPSPTATVTITPTITPSPIPTETIIELTDSFGIQKLVINETTHAAQFRGSSIPGVTIDSSTGDFKLQVTDEQGNEQVVTIPEADIQKRLGVKEGSVVIYDKDQALYNNTDMSQWPKVMWAYNPSVTEGQWAGWKERKQVISIDMENPVIVGNSYDDYFKFIQDEKSFFQPYTEKAKWPKVIAAGYMDYPDFPPPFGSFNIQNDSGGDNPFRDGANFWIVQANDEKGEDRIVKDVGGITEQVLDPNDRFDVQVFHFVSGQDKKTPINESYNVLHLPSYKTYFYYYGTMTDKGCLLPSYFIGGKGSVVSRTVELYDFYKKFGYITQTDQSIYVLNEQAKQFMTTGKITEELEKVWFSEVQIWYK